MVMVVVSEVSTGSTTDCGLTNEGRILAAVKKLLLEDVNGVLDEMKDGAAHIDGIDGDGGTYGVQPVVRVKEAEVSEKERVLRISVYNVAITIRAKETECFRYAYAIDRALRGDVTLSGIAEWSCLAGSVYKPVAPGTDYDGVYSIRVTVAK
jgi:hypothetical protein